MDEFRLDWNTECTDTNVDDKQTSATEPPTL